MNWATFFVNQFLIDCVESREKGMEFHYVWLVILIALVAGREPDKCQFLKTSQREHAGVRYVNIWHTMHKGRQQDNNVTFYVYFDTIRHIIDHTAHHHPHCGELSGYRALQSRDAPHVYPI